MNRRSSPRRECALSVPASPAVLVPENDIADVEHQTPSFEQGRDATSCTSVELAFVSVLT